MEYVVTLERDTNSSYWVRCPDIPEMNSVGDTVEDALKEALDGLETAFTIYMDQRRTIPMPTPAKAGEYTVRIPVKVAAKVLLFNEMIAQKVTKAEMARRLDGFQASADRILSIKHSTKLETLEAAFAVLGKHLDLRVA